ncbi:hypothetical protein BJ508DRAFT_242477 [Ascobolus immersus RN42]|uniref:Concanavalin A-like lectin/glucanase n=1 Tax=Ascobolus immersus RN42 TaxID=1160509 RepID=A0A3N4HTP2_ASCIM|nr:hypothetical protein BJ508DRAFT_242477 [Ascobolus immersus RN42]
MRLLAPLLLFLAHLTSVQAATWYFLRWNLPSGGNGYTSFSGSMRIPRIPKAGTYYLWPGLQPADNTGVLQAVLDGRKGTWWIGCGWCCQNPSLPWGGGFNTYQGETVQFEFTRNGNVWNSKLVRNGQTTTGSFNLGNKRMNQALLAIELTGVPWDFGALQFDNLVIKADTTQTGWCTNAPENYNGATAYSRNNVRASVSGNTATCNIGQVVLQAPAK